jgi:hypothetical protein
MGTEKYKRIELRPVKFLQVFLYSIAIVEQGDSWCKNAIHVVII